MKLVLAAAVAGLALQWVVLLVRLMAARTPDVRAGRERWFLMSSMLVALMWLVAASPESAVAIRGRTPVSAAAANCAAVSPGEPVSSIPSSLGNVREVSEEETRGPGAVARVYDEARCVVHVLGGTITGIDYE